MRQLVLAVVGKLQDRGVKVCPKDCAARCNGSCHLIDELAAELEAEGDSLLVLPSAHEVRA